MSTEHITELDPQEDSIRKAVEEISAVNGSYLNAVYKLTNTAAGNGAMGWQPAMQLIKKEYGRMKSGINHINYCPSVLMKSYAYAKGYSNEKRAMKLRIPAVIHFNNKYDDPNPVPRTVVPPAPAPGVTPFGSFPND